MLNLLFVIFLTLKINAFRNLHLKARQTVNISTTFQFPKHNYLQIILTTIMIEPKKHEDIVNRIKEDHKMYGAVTLQKLQSLYVKICLSSAKQFNIAF